MSWNDNPKRKPTKQDVALRLLAALALFLAAIALLSIELRSDEVEPWPTISATSYVEPAATYTPVLQPWPPVRRVYLPLIGGE